MSEDNLRFIFDFAEKSHEENYWQSFFPSESDQPSTFSSHPIANSAQFPPCDVFRDEKNLIIEMELPQIRLEDVSLTFQQNILILSGKYNTLRSNTQYYLKERQNRSFEKKITLPILIDKKKVTYSYQNGILTIRHPFSK